MFECSKLETSGIVEYTLLYNNIDISPSLDVFAIVNVIVHQHGNRVLLIHNKYSYYIIYRQYKKSVIMINMTWMPKDIALRFKVFAKLPCAVLCVAQQVPVNIANIYWLQISRFFMFFQSGKNFSLLLRFFSNLSTISH